MEEAGTAQPAAARRARGWRTVLLCLLAIVLVVAVVGVVVGNGGEHPEASRALGPTADISPFQGLGTWVDGFGYLPRLQKSGAPPIVPGVLQGLPGLGVKTLYLEGSTDDNPDATDPLLDRDLTSQMLERAHDAGLRVVAWYVPSLADVDVDLRRLTALLTVVPGVHFDAVALDIEWTQSVPDVAERNRRIVTLAQRLRQFVGPDVAIGAIVYPPVQLEVLNPLLWPVFPYRQLAPYIDVWLPMTYWTFRSGDYRDPYRYVTESVRRLRADIGDQSAVVHVIGGLTDQSTRADYESFVRAVHDVQALGWSMYDLSTTPTPAWAWFDVSGG
jgi:hypothetical protein